MNGEGQVTLFLSDPALRISRSGGHFVVRRRGELAKRVPLIRMGSLVMREGVSFSMDSLATLMEHEIPYFLVGEDGKFLGSLVPSLRHDPAPRLRQFESLRDGRARAGACRALAGSVLSACAAFLKECPAGPAGGGFGSLPAKLDSAGPEEVRDILESARRTYETGRSSLLPPGLRGTTRASALFLFGGILLVQEMRSVLLCEGLDPEMGLGVCSPPDLARELAWPLLPGTADRLGVELLRERAVRRKDFRPPCWFDGEFLLSREGQEKYFRAWAGVMSGAGGEEPSPRSLLRLQAAGFKSAVRDGVLDHWVPVAVPETGSLQPAGGA